MLRGATFDIPETATQPFGTLRASTLRKDAEMQTLEPTELGNALQEMWGAE